MSTDLLQRNMHGYHRRVARCEPFINAKNQKERLNWANTNMNRDGQNVIFTDEASLEIGMDPRHTTYISHLPGEEFLDQNIVPTLRSNRKSLVVWGAIASDHKRPLLRVPLEATASDGKARKKAEGLNGAKYLMRILCSEAL